MKDKTFREKVFDVVSRIPRGSVLTYKEVARLAGSPNAARAVGSALKTNYNPDIPCHSMISPPLLASLTTRSITRFSLIACSASTGRFS